MKNIKQYESHNDLTFPIKVRFPQQLHGSAELKAAWGNDTSQREARLPVFYGMLSHDGKDSAAEQAEAGLASRLVLSQALISLLFAGSLSCPTYRLQVWIHVALGCHHHKDAGDQGGSLLLQCPHPA